MNIDELIEELYYAHNELDPVKVSGIDTVHMTHAFNAIENVILSLQKAKKDSEETTQTSEKEE